MEQESQMTIRMRSSLLDYVEAAESANLLFALLNHMELPNIQKFLRDQIKQMNPQAIDTLHHRALPINLIFSSDVIQHILSFGNCNQNKTVCQQWNRLNQQNEDNMIRANCRLVERSCSDLPAPIDKWVVHRTRPHLHPTEKRMGFLGPKSDLFCANGVIDQVCQSYINSARILLYPGNSPYRLMNFWPEKDCVIQFIGPHQRCRINSFESIRVLRELRMDNLDITSIRDGERRKYSFIIDKNSKLIFRRCTLKLGGCIKVKDGASLEITDCSLYGNTDLSKDAICISPMAANVDITRNTFKDFSHGVTILRGNNESVQHSAKVHITDNTFEDCSEHPIIQEMGQNDAEQRSDCCILQGNRRIATNSADSVDINAVHVIEPSRSNSYSYDSDSSSYSSSSTGSYSSSSTGSYSSSYNSS